MDDVLADLPTDIADLVARAPAAETKKLLELCLAWSGLADAEARVADRLRVFRLTWDPLGWTDPDRGMAWATANGDGDDFEVVLYALLDVAIDRARSRETSLREVLAYEAESALAVAARYELAVRYGAYPAEVADGQVPGLLSERPRPAAGRCQRSLQWLASGSRSAWRRSRTSCRRRSARSTSTAPPCCSASGRCATPTVRRAPAGGSASSPT